MPLAACRLRAAGLLLGVWCMGMMRVACREGIVAGKEEGVVRLLKTPAKVLDRPLFQVCVFA